MRHKIEIYCRPFVMMSWTSQGIYTRWQPLLIENMLEVRTGWEFEFQIDIAETIIAFTIYSCFICSVIISTTKEDTW